MSHQSCSEAFYKDQVIESLKGQRGDIENRQEMMRMLRDLENEEEEEEEGLIRRLEGINLEEATFHEVWERLTEEERATFQRFAQDDPEKVVEEGEGGIEWGGMENMLDTMTLPWWDKAFLGDGGERGDWGETGGGIEEMDQDEMDSEKEKEEEEEEEEKEGSLISSRSARPRRPLILHPIPRYRELTQAPWNPKILHYLPSILFAYAYVGRVLGGDWEEGEGGLEACWALAPVLAGKERVPPADLEESLAQVLLRLTDQSIPCIQGQPVGLTQLALEDVGRFISSPSLVLAFLVAAVAVVRSSPQAKEVWLGMQDRVKILLQRRIYERQPPQNPEDSGLVSSWIGAAQETSSLTLQEASPPTTQKRIVELTDEHE
ncbi:MAG: hypothetical protein DHS80DRAFT_30691 [Piptocephalis tieghemiana]|nr:MAG: hypothetical protein DHS80DRAFT_30691 [Piptocephalis tieghemiana]